MATKASTATESLPDGAFDWSAGVDSSRVTTLQSALNPEGLPRNALSWLNNATVRNGGIIQRTGWQPLCGIVQSGHWQGGFLYQPDNANPYLVCSISGHIYSVLLDPPYTVTELFNTLVAPWLNYGDNVGLVIDGNLIPHLQNDQFNPDTEMVWFCQAENYLIIQAGDFNTLSPATLPLIWNGTVLRRSIGITTTTPSGYLPGINEIPAATCMWYHGNRIWYAENRQVSAGDMVGGPSGTLANHYRDAVLSVTENPLCVGGDGFTLPTNSGNIRALRDEVNLNESVAQSRLLIWTRKAVFALSVPVTRTDWINANSANQPLLVPVQKVNGAVGDRCVVASNGDWFYQSFDPAIRSLITAVRYFTQWGNTPISQNENRALAYNDRGLMRFSGAMEFDNRIWNLILPTMAADGVNVVNLAVLPLDFDVVSNLKTTREQSNAPVWEGAYDGLQFLEVFSGDFGGLPRGFAAIVSQIDGALEIWELTTASRTENGDNRVTWAAEFPAFTWSASGLEFRRKQLVGGECWIDKVFGTVVMDVYYRPDGDPCWYFWTHCEFCVARNCQEEEPVGVCYPPRPFREGYKFPVGFPEPPSTCDSMGVRPTTVGYQFQVKIVIKGWCRIRGLILYAIPRENPMYEAVCCPPSSLSLNGGMRRLPLPGAATPMPAVPEPPRPPITPTPPAPPAPTGGMTGAGGDAMQGAGGDAMIGAGGD